MARTKTRYAGSYKGATAPVYYTDAGPTFGAEIRDGLTPTINRILKQIAPEVERLLQRELLDPVVEPARAAWPVGDYRGQSTTRRGGVSKKALKGAIEFDGQYVYAVVRNDAENPSGERYAWFIFEKGTAEFMGGTRDETGRIVRGATITKGVNVWNKLVYKPFMKRARKIEKPLVAAIDKLAGGK